MSSYTDLELKVLNWAQERRIIPNSTALAQAIKTHEEVGELLSALHRGDMAEAADAYGDVLVTLVIGADLAGLDLMACFHQAWDQIKDRRGYLRSDGVFVKES